jgi:hypothetical protein
MQRFRVSGIDRNQAFAPHIFNGMLDFPQIHGIHPFCATWQSNDGCTPLIKASQNVYSGQCLAVLRLLIDANAEVNKVDKVSRALITDQDISSFQSLICPPACVFFPSPLTPPPHPPPLHFCSLYLLPVSRHVSSVRSCPDSASGNDSPCDTRNIA